jgi:hypothetical protein
MVSSGRLGSAVKRSGCKVLIDEYKALIALKMNTAQLQAEPEVEDKDEGESYSDLRKRTERYKAKLKRLDYKIRSGQYVERVRVERTAYAISRSIRDAVLSIGPRLAPVLAAESDLGLVGQILDRELNLALADLAGYVKRLGG